MKPTPLLVALLSVISLGLSQVSAQETLSLADYLKQVETSHQGFQANLMIRKGADLRSNDATLITSPSLVGGITLLHDDKNDPLFRTQNQTRDNYNIGISDVTSFGTTAKLSYNFDYSHYTFLPDTGSAPLTLNQGRPTLDVTQDLWRNGFGAETRATIDAAVASAESQSLTASYQTRLILAQAESAYWSLALAQSSVRVTSEVLDRAKKLFDWNQRRVRLRLADPSDLLQAEALLKLRELDFQQAKDNQRIASRTFNELKNMDSDAVTETVTALGPESIAAISMPARAGMREDVRAAEAQSRAAIASAKLANEKDKPSVQIFGSFSLNGSDQNINPTLSNSFKTDQPTIQGGVRLVMPLAFGTMSDAHKGYALEEEGAQRNFQRKFFEQESDWSDLNQKFVEAKRRYELYQSVELAQKEKLKIEQERLNRGKTTTFNVIQFEQDAAQAELGTLRAQTEILQIIAQLKTFGGPL